jgi:hypothetical protein
MGGTLVSSDIVEVHYLNIVGQTVNPSANSVGSSQLTADVITGQTELASGVASTDELLISDAGTLKRVDVSLIGGNNTPSFEAYLGASTNPSNNTETKIAFNTEVYDTDNCYDNSSNYRFTPTTAGKYFCYSVIRAGGGANQSQSNFTAQFNKNGSEYGKEIIVQNGTSYKGNNYTLTLSATIDFNGSSDYLEVFGLIDSSATGSFIGDSCRFGAFKIIT